jgi:hypothetical protein
MASDIHPGDPGSIRYVGVHQIRDLPTDRDRHGRADEMDAIASLAIQEVDAYVAVYSVTSLASFREAGTVRQKIVALCPRKTGPKIVVAGNMCDAPIRTVSTAAGERLAKKWGCPSTRRRQSGTGTRPSRSGRS